MFVSVGWTAQRTWIGGSANWDANNALWNPADEHDPDDEAIFNTPHTALLANTLEQIMALTLSGGIDLNSNNHGLTVDGLVQLTGAGATLIL